MKPKEKAIELVNKFLSYSWISNEEGNEVSSNTESAKQCALIAVDEILFNIDATILYHKKSIALIINKKYWQEVKQEIEKL